MSTIDEEMLHDYILAHGFGVPTQEGMELGLLILDDDKCSYSEAAAEVVGRGMVADILGGELWQKS